MKQFEDTYKPLPEGLTIMESKIEGLGLYAQTDFSAGYEFGETHVFAVSTNRREWVRTPLGGFINHSEEPNCKLVDYKTKMHLYTTEAIKAGEELTLKYKLYNPVEIIDER